MPYIKEVAFSTQNGDVLSIRQLFYTSKDIKKTIAVEIQIADFNNFF